MNRSDAGSPSSTTREALLDAAESLFAERGVESTSVRDITKAAGANLGAVNYHFRSKDLLILEVFARRLRPLNQQRLAGLDELEATQIVPSLEEILRALIRPTVEDETSGKRRTDEFMRLISRSFQESNEELKTFMSGEFDEIIKRFDAAILRAVPGLVKEELFWRMTFLFGALHHGLERWTRFESMPIPPGLDPAHLRPDIEGFIQRFITFAAAGMRAAAAL